ncbi:MAG: hypothetical protein OXT51_00725 [Chloroflexota bacterium]|nr:hypothetical protein [Chloroflexota bacterium]
MAWGSRNRGRSRSASGASRRPKGQVRNGKSVQYSIKSSSGRTKYYGVTNNPSRRASEHQKSGKLRRGDTFRVETRPVSRADAERVESAKLASHRRSHSGRNPRHNTTRSGQFEGRRSGGSFGGFLRKLFG